MSKASPAFETPPETKTPEGRLRRVGFELELKGLELPELARLVAREVGGEVEEENPHRYHVVDTEFGDFGVEIDWTLLSEQRLHDQIAELDPYEDFRTLTDKLEEKVAALAQTVVPLEIITPPIPLDRLAVMEDLRRKLHERGAIGTGASVAYAFGLHMNPEAPSFAAESLLAHLRAFLLVYVGLKERGDVDLTRRIVPFINPFPRAYVERVMAADYAPGRGRLIDDYLDSNPTRNRPLDLLPLFAHLDRDRVAKKVDDDLTQARPTYHYRLPGCLVDDPDWRIAREWNLWVSIERLAADEDQLGEMCASYRDESASPFDRLKASLREEVASWLG